MTVWKEADVPTNPPLATDVLRILQPSLNQSFGWHSGIQCHVQHIQYYSMDQWGSGNKQVQRDMNRSLEFGFGIPEFRRQKSHEYDWRHWSLGQRVVVAPMYSMHRYVGGKWCKVHQWQLKGRGARFDFWHDVSWYLSGNGRAQDFWKGQHVIALEGRMNEFHVLVVDVLVRGYEVRVSGILEEWQNSSCST